VIKKITLFGLGVGVLMGCDPLDDGGATKAGALRRISGWSAGKYFSGKDIELIEAIDREDVAGIQAVVRAGADVSCVGAEGMTPLAWALLRGKKKSFEALVKLRADVNYRSPAIGRNLEHASVMHFAVIHEDSFYLEKLLEAGGNPNALGIRDNVNLMYWAIENNRVKSVELLIKFGADVNHRGLGGDTALHYAAMRDRFEILDILLGNGADPKILDDRGKDFMSVVEVMNSYTELPYQAGTKKRRMEWMERYEARKGR
jgi:ankyrin repeat protein